MKIPVKPSLAVAFQVLKLVETRLQSVKYLSLECYSSGREQGFCISFWGMYLSKKICFSEYRSSDQIVVYLGDNINFSNQGHTPDEKACDTRSFFAYNQKVKAAHFIASTLKIWKDREEEEVQKRRKG